MATNAPNTGTPARAPFNPTAWLYQFESVGGAYLLANERLHLFIVRNPSQPTRQAQAMLNHLTFEQHRVIEDHLLQRPLPPLAKARPPRFHAIGLKALDIIGRITKACRQHRMAVTRFGREAVGDPGLYNDLARGRKLQPGTEARINQFIAGMGGQ